MAAKQVAQTVSKTVFKPLLSTSHVEARRRVMNLYRAWWREVLISVLLTCMEYFWRHKPVINKGVPVISKGPNEYVILLIALHYLRAGKVD